MGREKGGGFRMGNTCVPVADSFRYMAKPIQYCKVKKIFLKKILAVLSLCCSWKALFSCSSQTCSGGMWDFSSLTGD